jgi:hypothetical protein
MHTKNEEAGISHLNLVSLHRAMPNSPMHAKHTKPNIEKVVPRFLGIQMAIIHSEFN